MYRVKTAPESGFAGLSSSTFFTLIEAGCRAFTKVRLTVAFPPVRLTLWSAAPVWPTGTVVSTTQYCPKGTLVNEQSPSASVVQMELVAVSSAPRGAS